MLLIANLLLVNGRIWTPADGRPASAGPKFFQAVAIEGDRIVAVGSNDEVTAVAPRSARRIDLKGRLVVPGFIDNHVHFIDGGMQLSRVSLRTASTPTEFASRISAYAKKAGKGTWVIGASALLGARQHSESIEEQDTDEQNRK